MALIFPQRNFVLAIFLSSSVFFGFFFDTLEVWGIRITRRDDAR